MTINVLRGRGRATEVEDTPTTIGAADEQVFNCPQCARPLVVGAARCAGCGTRLVLGIQLRRAGLFIALGVAIGSLVGGGAVAVSISGALAAAFGQAPVVPVATAAPPPLATAAPVATPAIDPGPAAVSATAVSALRQTATLNARLAFAAQQLRAEIAAKALDTAAVATTLRAIASDAASGEGIAPRVGTWEAATALSADLGGFYRDARASARAGLAASLANEPAYRAAAAEMVGILDAIGALDAASRVLAAEAGTTLPPVDVPGEAPAP